MQINQLLTPSYDRTQFKLHPLRRFIKSESNANIFPTSNIYSIVERFTCQAPYKIKLVCRTIIMTALLISSQQDSKKSNFPDTIQKDDIE